MFVKGHTVSCDNKECSSWYSMPVNAW